MIVIHLIARLNFGGTSKYLISLNNSQNNFIAKKSDGEIIKNNDLVKYSTISTTLLYKDVSSIPKSRIKILKREIKNHFGIKRLTTKRLKSISEIKSSFTTKTHGEIVVGKIDDFQVFIEMWRKHFVDNTSAKYLPENWSVKIKIKIDVR